VRQAGVYASPELVQGLPSWDCAFRILKILLEEIDVFFGALLTTKFSHVEGVKAGDGVNREAALLGDNVSGLGGPLLSRGEDRADRLVGEKFR
jgi:hypothetical protein